MNWSNRPRSRRPLPPLHAHAYARSEPLERRTLLTLVPAATEFPVLEPDTDMHLDLGKVAMDAEGNFAFVSDSVTSGADHDFVHAFIHLYDTTGARRRAPFRVDVGEDWDWSDVGAIDMAPSGDFVIAGMWDDVRGHLIRARAFKADGTPKGPSVAVERPDDPFVSGPNFYDLAIKPNGDFLVAWTAYDGGATISPPPAERLYVRQFEADGTPAGAALPVAEVAGTATHLKNVALDINDAGDALVAWRPFDVLTQAAPVHARRVNAAGQPSGPEVVVTGNNGFGIPRVESSAGGRFVVTWQDGPLGQDGVRGQVYTDLAQPATGKFTVVDTAPAGYVLAGGDLAVEADGDFVVAFSFYADSPRSFFAPRQAYYQQYNSSAQRVGQPVFAFSDEEVHVPSSTYIAVNDAGTLGVIAHSFQPLFEGERRDALNGRLLEAGPPAPDPDPIPNPNPDPIPRPNTPPTASAIAPLVATRDAADTVIPLWSYFQDGEDPDSALKLSVAADTNPLLFTAVRINAADGTLTLDYAPGATGTANLTLSATDTGGLSASTIFTVTVNPPALPDPVPQPQPPQVVRTGVPAEAGINAIVGVLFDDADGNGRRSKSEAPLAGVRLFLDADGDGAYEVGETTTTTAADGGYGITNIAPGTYHLRADLPAGRAGGAADVFLPRRPFARPTRVKPLGVSASGSLGGVAFLDANANGLRDPGEPALRRAKVFLDTNGDGVWQKKQERRAKADAAGNFTFAHLPGGTYRVAVVPRSARAVGSTSAHVLEVTLGEGQARTDLLLGP